MLTLNPKKQAVRIEPRLSNAIHLALTVFTILFIIFVFGPVYLANNSGTKLEPYLLLTALGVSFGISVIAGCAAFPLKGKYKYIEGFVTGVLLACFITALILPFNAGVLDGIEELTSNTDISILIRSAVVLAVCVTAAYILRKHLRVLPVPLLALCLALTLINYEAPVKPEAEDSEILKSVQTFSSGKNVVVIALDMLQGTVAEKAFKDSPEFLDLFDGFTLFTRAFSSFPFTTYSQPVIQSGVTYASDSEAAAVNRSASIADSFLTDMRDNGARVDALHVETGGLFPSMESPAEIKSEYQRHNYGVAITASVARISGFWIKNPFVAVWDEYPDFGGKLNSARFYDYVLTDFTVGDETPKCLYFWDNTLHSPFGIKRDGGIARGSEESTMIGETLFKLGQLAALFEHMKSVGVYDNSLIIFVSDHGHPIGERQNHYGNIPDYTDGYKTYGSFRAVNWYNTILFIKPPYAGGKAEITYAPAWSGDVRALVDYYFNNFQNDPAAETVSAVRGNNPSVDVMYAVDVVYGDVWDTATHHRLIQVSSLYDIGPAIAEKTGVYDK